MTKEHSRRKPTLTGKRYNRLSDCLTDHYLVLLLFLTLVSLTLGGAGNARIAGMAGLLLCAAGCLQGNLIIDLWVLTPLLVFDGFSMASSWHTYGTIAAGFVPTQTVFTAMYLLMAYLDERDRLSLRHLCVAWVGSAAAWGIGEYAFHGQFPGHGCWAADILSEIKAAGWTAESFCLRLTAIGKGGVGRGNRAVAIYRGPEDRYALAVRFAGPVSAGFGAGLAPIFYIS